MNGQVKVADIGTDAVGGSELIGVTKLLFGQCAADSTEGGSMVGSGSSLTIQCTISGVDSDDSAIATQNSGNPCFEERRTTPFANRVDVLLINECVVTDKFGVGGKISVIVYDK